MIVMGCTGAAGMKAPFLNVMSAVPLVQVLSGNMTMVGHFGAPGESLAFLLRCLRVDPPNKKKKKKLSLAGVNSYIFFHHLVASIALSLVK